MAWQSSNLCPARMRGHIASTGSPRSLRSLAITIILKCVNKKIKALYQVPLYGGVPRSGGVVREYKNAFPFCHCEPSQMAWQSSNLCPALKRDFITTGSPRSLRSPSQMAWQSSKLCTHANACDFICTLNFELCTL